MKFIREHNVVVWRFHDHWHMRRPDGIRQGILQAVAWEKHYDPETRFWTPRR